MFVYCPSAHCSIAVSIAWPNHLAWLDVDRWKDYSWCPDFREEGMVRVHIKVSLG